MMPTMFTNSQKKGIRPPLSFLSPNRFHRALSGLAMSSAFMATAMLSAHAGNMYVYKDTSGQVLLTNVNPSGSFNQFDQRIKSTYYPSSTANTQATANTANTAARATPVSFGPFNGSQIGIINNRFDHFIIASANRHGVDPALMKSMMHAESAFNPNARSHAGAQGLMQLMPATASRFKVRNPWNPQENIEGAAKYIAWLSRRFDGKVEYVVAGYNAGEGNVDKYGGIPPFRETQNYVRKVISRYNSDYNVNSNINPANSITTRATVQPVSQQTRNGQYAQSAYGALR